MKKFFPVCIVLLLLGIVCLVPFTAWSRPITGALETIQDKRVLNLRGTHYSMGYAHGYLLADDIMELLEDYMLGRLYDVENYWRTVLLISSFVRVPASYRNEIAGMFRGIMAARGASGVFIAALGRDLRPVDLLAWNMVPEIFRLEFGNRLMSDQEPRFSSSLSGWGDNTADGSLILARDLDFGFPGDLLDQRSIIIAYHRPGLLEQDWISITWPGLIGCLTGMNRQGVGAALDLGNNEPELEDLFLIVGGIPVGVPRYYTPITFALRRGVERRRPFRLRRDPLGNFLRIVSSAHIAGSFAVHIFAPSGFAANGAVSPAAILECSNRGAVLRTAADNRDAEPVLLSDEYLAVTNHHRKLFPPVECPRYAVQVERLNSIGILDMDTALDIQREIAQDEGPFNTVLMAGFVPDELRVWVSFADGGQSAAEAEPSLFFWDDFFRDAP